MVLSKIYELKIYDCSEQFLNTEIKQSCNLISLIILYNIVYLKNVLDISMVKSFLKTFQFVFYSVRSWHNAIRNVKCLSTICRNIRFEIVNIPRQIWLRLYNILLERT